MASYGTLISPALTTHPFLRDLRGWWLAGHKQSGFGTDRWVDLSSYGTAAVLTNKTPSTDWASDYVNKSYMLNTNGTNERATMGEPSHLQLASGPITMISHGYDTAGGNSILTHGESRGLGTTRSYDFFDTGSQLRFHGHNAAGSAIIQIDTTTRPALNTWHTYAGDWDGGNLARLFVDGELVGTDTSIAGPSGSGYNWNIGGAGGAGDFTWTGRIHTVMIFARQLSALEHRFIHQEIELGYPNLLNTISNNAYNFFQPSVGGFFRIPQTGSMNGLGSGGPFFKDALA